MRVVFFPFFPFVNGDIRRRKEPFFIHLFLSPPILWRRDSEHAFLFFLFFLFLHQGDTKDRLSRRCRSFLVFPLLSSTWCSVLGGSFLFFSFPFPLSQIEKERQSPVPRTFLFGPSLPSKRRSLLPFFSFPSFFSKARGAADYHRARATSPLQLISADFERFPPLFSPPPPARDDKIPPLNNSSFSAGSSTLKILHAGNGSLFPPFPSSPRAAEAIAVLPFEAFVGSSAIIKVGRLPLFPTCDSAEYRW